MGKHCSVIDSNIENECCHGDITIIHAVTPIEVKLCPVPNTCVQDAGVDSPLRPCKMCDMARLAQITATFKSSEE